MVGRETQRAFVCANAQAARAIDANTAFEIGSISKTMTALLLADLIEQGSLDLDDALSMHLPEGTALLARVNPDLAAELQAFTTTRV